MNKWALVNTKDIKNQLIVMKHVANVYAGVFLTGNYDNHKDWVPSMLPYKIWLIFMGMATENWK